MIETKKMPTMKDVAQEAGVALGTVSKVVNGIPVGEEYRLRVEAAIEKLNYRVSSYARGLRGSRTYVIAVMLPNLVSPYFAKLADCINSELSARKYHMQFFATDYDPALEQEMVYLAEQQKVDGIICLSYNPNLQIPSGIPAVSIDRCFASGIPCVSADNYNGGRLAAEKLIENGCKNLAFLRIGSKLTNEPNKRRDGFISACEANNIAYTLRILDDYTPYSVFEGFLHEHFHDGKLDFDGVFCVTDSLAHQTVRTLESMGVNVPRDVQVIGFDGIRYFGDLEYICSTIVQPVEAIAAKCVEMILDKPSDVMPSLVCLPVKYAFGGTTNQ